MKPEAEKYLWDRIRMAGDINGKMPREIIGEMVDSRIIQSPKQAWRTLEKWLAKGKYNYGVCLDLGWRETINHE